MNGKKSKKTAPSAPAWMVTYSDLVTLLLTFFVLLLSMANMDPVKFLKVANSMRSAFGIVGNVEGLDITPKVINIAPVHDKDMAQRVYKRIQTQLNKLQLNKDIILVVDRGAVVLRVDSMLLFAHGQSDILPAAYPTLRKVADLVRPLPFHLRVEGHTDSTGDEKVNWDISMDRATSVIKFFMAGKLLPLDRMSAAGYGAQRPIVPNDTPGNRALNRRVEFVLESVGSYTKELPFLIDAREQFPF
jgi:chemotaxis protein MotB